MLKGIESFGPKKAPDSAAGVPRMPGEGTMTGPEIEAFQEAVADARIQAKIEHSTGETMLSSFLDKSRKSLDEGRSYLELLNGDEFHKLMDTMNEPAIEVNDDALGVLSVEFARREELKKQKKEKEEKEENEAN